MPADHDPILIEGVRRTVVRFPGPPPVVTGMGLPTPPTVGAALAAMLSGTVGGGVGVAVLAAAPEFVLPFAVGCGLAGAFGWDSVGAASRAKARRRAARTVRPGCTLVTAVADPDSPSGRRQVRGVVHEVSSRADGVWAVLADGSEVHVGRVL